MAIWRAPARARCAAVVIPAVPPPMMRILLCNSGIATSCYPVPLAPAIAPRPYPYFHVGPVAAGLRVGRIIPIRTAGRNDFKHHRNLIFCWLVRLRDALL